MAVILRFCAKSNPSVVIIVITRLAMRYELRYSGHDKYQCIYSGHIIFNYSGL